MPFVWVIYVLSLAVSPGHCLRPQDHMPEGPPDRIKQTIMIIEMNTNSHGEQMEKTILIL